jgi:drug/metabolite transporter (DMT)-like permease
MPSPAAPGPDASRGRLEVLAAGVLWSFAGVFIKSIAAPPAVIALTRSFCAALVFAPFVRRLPSPRPAVLLASVLLYTGVVGLFVWSTKVTSAANAIILQYTAPAFVFGLEWLLLGGRPPRRDLLTLAGGMTGIAVIYLGSEAGDLLGISLALLSGLLFAAWMVLVRWARELDPVALTCANNLGAAILLLGPALLTASAWPTPPQILALAVMGAVQLGLPYLLFARGVKHVTSQEASLIVLVEPVLNPVWVALVVGEVPSRATLAGGVIILAALVARYAWPVGRPRGAAS